MRKWPAFIILTGVALIFGFYAGKAVGASTVPGSAEDPLVTKSYVKILEDRNTALEAKVNQLEARINSHEGSINGLRNDVNHAHNRITSHHPPVKTVVTKYGYIRSGAGGNYRVIMRVKKGTKLTVLQVGGWNLVRTSSGKTGWIIDGEIR